MWIGSVEFYVITCVIAAAAVAAAALPSRRGASTLHLIAGELSGDDESRHLAAAVDVAVDDNGVVVLRRSGLTALTDNGAASLAVSVTGFDIVIEERLTPGDGWPTVDTATFRLDFLAPERYHVKYNSSDTELFVVFTLNVMPGIKIHRDLK